MNAVTKKVEEKVKKRHKTNAILRILTDFILWKRCTEVPALGCYLRHGLRLQEFRVY